MVLRGESEKNIFQIVTKQEMGDRLKMGGMVNGFASIFFVYDGCVLQVNIYSLYNLPLKDKFNSQM